MSEDSGPRAVPARTRASAVAQGARPWQAAATAVAAIDLGVIGDALLRAPGPPGLNLALWSAALAGVVALLARRGQPLSREGMTLLALAVLFAAGFAWRDAPTLKLLNFACVAACFALVGYRRGEAWLRGSSVLQYAYAMGSAGLSGAFGGFGLTAEIDWRRGTAGAPWRRHGLAVVRGLALSLPVLVVFGTLLAGADAIFQDLLLRTLRLDVRLIVGHVVLTTFVAWISAGYLRELWAGVPAPARFMPVVNPRLGIVELALPLGLLNLLFAGFVAVQVRYLFGGESAVLTTAGLTYAEYARHGFFELVAVAALVLPLLLAGDALLERRGPGDEWIYRGLAGTQLALVFAIMASALQRMRLYQATYGLTEQRLYATAFMLWMAVVAIWLVATVLVGRRRRFGVGVLASGAAAVVLLNLLNPDALIVRVNAARAVRGERFDPAYLAMLSADAVPPLVQRLASMPPRQRCETAQALGRWWRRRQPPDWRSWSLDRARARDAMEGLRRHDIGDPQCVWKVPAPRQAPAPGEPEGATSPAPAGAAPAGTTPPAPPTLAPAGTAPDAQTASPPRPGKR